MSLDPAKLAKTVSSRTGLAFVAESGVDQDGQRYYVLLPKGLSADHTFAIRTTVGWRRLSVAFEPGKFASELLAEMGHADHVGRAAFEAVLDHCRDRGAEIHLTVNECKQNYADQDIWKERWTRISLSINKGQLELGSEDGDPDAEILSRWTSRFVAAVVAILPLQEDAESVEADVVGFPEGALVAVQVNRYERDRRNRAAAISIHGTICHGCRVNLAARYGDIAQGFIEVHHTTPVSQVGPGYMIDPIRDLVPLCPNCHAIAHRRSPPLSVEDIRTLLCHD